MYSSMPQHGITIDTSGDITWGHVHGKEIAAGRLDSFDMLNAEQAEQIARLARETQSRSTGRRAEIELRIDGKPRIYDMRFEPAGMEVSVVGFDITAAKSAELALRETE